MRLRIQSFPNREIRVHVSYEPSPRGGSCGGDSDEDDGGLETRDSSVEGVQSSSAGGSEGSSLLDITGEVETTGCKPGFGLLPRRTEFGLYAKRKILRVGGVLDEVQSSPSEGIFLTGTIPGSTLEAFHAVACWSGWLVHRLKAWIGKRVRAKYDFYVWELQSRGALHLHYFVHVPEPDVRAEIVRGFKAQWARLLDGVCERSGVDCWDRGDGYSHSADKDVLQAYAQEVKKSVAAYLAKYCSKGSSVGGGGEAWFCPVRWWGVSRPLSRLLDERTETFEVLEPSFGVIREKFRECVDVLKGFAIRCHEYAKGIGTGLNAVAYVSKPEQGAILKEMLERIGVRMMDKYNQERYALACGRLKRVVAGILRDVRRKAVLDSGNTADMGALIYAWYAGVNVDMWNLYVAVENAIYALSDYFADRDWFAGWARDFMVAGADWLMIAGELLPECKRVLEMVPASVWSIERKAKVLARVGALEKEVPPESELAASPRGCTYTSPLESASVRTPCQMVFDIDCEGFDGWDRRASGF